MANIQQGEATFAFSGLRIVGGVDGISSADGGIEQWKDVRPGQREQCLRSMVERGVDGVVAAVPGFLVGGRTRISHHSTLLCPLCRYLRVW
jgi:hypothetical protein